MPIDDSGSPPGVDGHEPGAAQRWIVLSFCATVLIGVLVCAAYLARGGTRVAVRVTPKSRNPSVATIAAAPAAIAPAAPKPSPPAETAPLAKAPAAVVGATYLQMAAVDKGVANVYVEVLRRKGFQAIVASGPTPEIFRVLVGPVKDAAALARVKSELQAAGFNSFARKLTSE